MARVIGAGYAISPETGDVAAYVKLLRAALLPVVVIAIASATTSRGNSGTPVLLFAVAFAVILLADSAGLVSAPLGEAMGATSRWLLVAAIAAPGMKTSLKAMFALGPGRIAIVALETAVLAGVAVRASLLP